MLLNLPVRKLGLSQPEPQTPDVDAAECIVGNKAIR